MSDLESFIDGMAAQRKRDERHPVLTLDEAGIERLAAAIKWFDEKGWLAYPNYGNSDIETQDDDYLTEARAIVEALRAGAQP